MVIKQNKILALLLIVTTIIPFIFSAIVESRKYIYSLFVVDRYTLIISLLLIIVANVILLGVLYICKKSVLLKIILLLPITLFTLWGMLVASAFLSGNFWTSNVKNFEDFSEVDSSLEKVVKIAGLSLGDITVAEIDVVEDFEYSYTSRLLFSTFKFRGHFTFSEKSYNEIKNAFYKAPEFNETVYDEQKKSEYKMTGEFVIDNTISKYETTTSVDEWYTAIIRFNDENFSFYFDLYGGYHT